MRKTRQIKLEKVLVADKDTFLHCCSLCGNYFTFNPSDIIFKKEWKAKVIEFEKEADKLAGLIDTAKHQLKFLSWYNILKREKIKSEIESLQDRKALFEARALTGFHKSVKLHCRVCDNEDFLHDEQTVRDARSEENIADYMVRRNGDRC